jgi:hypothetical protein
VGIAWLQLKPKAQEKLWYLNHFWHSPNRENWADILSDLSVSGELLVITFENLYNTINHMKLIQHQYKILTMKATSKFMRYKTKISTTFN